MKMSPYVAVALMFHVFLRHITAVSSIGVNYGTMANNLASPDQVVRFITQKTTIDRVKMFDADPGILQSFANTGIFVATTVPNNDIPSMADVGNARRWVNEKIRPFHPTTKISYILVGNEILHGGIQSLIDNLVPAMKSIHQALQESGMSDIKVTTPQAISLIENIEPPSLAKFRQGLDVNVISPMLQFLRQANSPFMVNPYPYFAYSPERADFMLFRPNKGYYDGNSQKTYENMFELMLDSVHVSLEKMGYADVDIVVGETGWSSLGEPYEQPRCSLENAAAYNGGLSKYINSGRGTPLMPNRSFETYIFALFNENQKNGLSEKNFGLFRPDFTPVYDAGIMRGGALQ